MGTKKVNDFLTLCFQFLLGTRIGLSAIVAFLTNTTLRLFWVYLDRARVGRPVANRLVWHLHEPAMVLQGVAALVFVLLQMARDHAGGDVIAFWVLITVLTYPIVMASLFKLASDDMKSATRAVRLRSWLASKMIGYVSIILPFGLLDFFGALK